VYKSFFGVEKKSFGHAMVVLFHFKSKIDLEIISMKNNTYSCGIQTPYKIQKKKWNSSIGKIANDRKNY
jgi:hypothetical protein